jgi:hypothetical protein
MLENLVPAFPPAAHLVAPWQEAADAVQACVTFWSARHLI